MRRIVVTVIAGMLLWLALATIGGLALRALWPAYVAAEPRFAFTLPMQLARLLIGGESTLVAGLLAARMTAGNRHATLALGVTLLVIFVPNHYYLRDKFPLWYHLTFLASLIPLTLLGEKLAGRSKARTIPAHALDRRV